MVKEKIKKLRDKSQNILLSKVSNKINLKTLIKKK
jgi:hypothetical protein